MSTLREAAQQALRDLEQAEATGACEYASTAAFRAALAQQEPRNQCGETCERAKLCAVCARGLEQEPVVVRAEALDLILEAAEVLDKVRVSCDAWEKYGLRDFLPDELTGTAGMLRDGSALTHPPRRETEQEPVALFTKYGPPTMRDRDFWSAGYAAGAARAVEQALKERNT
jgi:hypothetical protein